MESPAVWVLVTIGVMTFAMGVAVSAFAMRLITDEIASSEQRLTHRIGKVADAVTGLANCLGHEG